MGGAIAAVESGYMKQELVSSHAARRARIESGEEVVVGVNRFETTEPSPLTADPDAAIQAADPEAEQSAIESVRAWKAERDEAAVTEALARLAAEAKTDANLMTATLAAARAGATTGEWAATLRAVFGEFRAPTGVSGAVGACRRGPAGEELAEVRRRVRETGEELSGGQAAGCDCWSASRASTATPTAPSRSPYARATQASRSIYQGIRLTPEEIVAAAVAEDVHCVGLSILSGSHMELVPAVLVGLEEAGIGDVPVVVGGIIPDSDARKLIDAGVAAVYTPKDFGLTEIMGGIVEAIREANDLA